MLNPNAPRKDDQMEANDSSEVYQKRPDVVSRKLLRRIRQELLNHCDFESPEEDPKKQQRAISLGNKHRTFARKQILFLSKKFSVGRLHNLLRSTTFQEILSYLSQVRI